MITEEKIRNEIKDRVQNISSDKLNSLLEYIRKLELSNDRGNSSVLKYFGDWSDLDEELFEELTEDLPKKRLEETKDLS